MSELSATCVVTGLGIIAPEGSAWSETKALSTGPTKVLLDLNAFNSLFDVPVPIFDILGVPPTSNSALLLSLFSIPPW